MAKILFISNMYPSKQFPSYGIFVKKTESILKKKHTVKSIVLRKHVNSLVKYVSYMVFYFRIVICGLFMKGNTIYANYASHTSFPIRIVKKIRPEIFIITNVHGNDVIPANRKDQKMLVQTEALLARSDLVIVPSTFFKAEVIRRFGIDEEKIRVFPSGGVDTRHYRILDKDVSKLRVGLDTAAKYIGYVSRLENGKGWDTFLWVAKKICENKSYDDYNFVIAGYGNDEAKVDTLIREYGISKRIVRIKNICPSSLPFIYNSFDVFVFSSRLSESLGMVGLEAMACGILSILPDRYGPNTYAMGGVNGFVVNTSDRYAVLDAVEKILRLSKKRKKEISDEARRTAKKFDSEIASQNLLNIIERALQKGGIVC